MLGVTIDEGKGRLIHRWTKQYPLAGARAEVVVTPAGGSRITGTRVAAGGVLFGPLGALGGAAAKKRGRPSVTVHVEGPDFGFVVDVPVTGPAPRHLAYAQKRAMKLKVKINSAARNAEAAR
jgi:hypothetical protein